MSRYLVGLVLGLSMAIAASSAAQDCVTCHGTGSDPAPPLDTSGNAMTTARGVGAHQSHLGTSTWHAEVSCSDCHLVPAATGDPGHNDTSLPAELTWGALASADGATPSWNGTTCTTYCHGSTLPEGGTTPVWTQVDGSQAACGTCHGAPPAAPHPPQTDCSLCHPGMGPAMTFVDETQHIDGTVQVLVMTCTTCHGTGSDPAPPLDTSGNAMTTARGVGAHQSHLGTSTWHAEVSCSDCHLVPAATGDPGHNDTSLPAELTWGALASADGATPSWNGTTCTTYCHGSTLPEGGTTPVWTQVDGSQAACGTCHGAPPAAPHPPQTDCSLCHPGMGPAMTFVDATQHIDGTVQAVIEVPVIISVDDVPGDQGSQVRLYWERSIYDDTGSIYPITDYAVWRQIPPGAKKTGASKIVVPRAMFPTGDWDYVSTVPARGEFQYNTLAPTLCDSTSEGNCLSTFFVSAITADPLVYFDSTPASGYSVDNLAPAVPVNFVLAGSLLNWDEPTEADFKYFSIYGSAAATRDETAVLIDHTIGTLFDVAGHPYAYYHLTATDFAGNEGLAASTISVSGVPGTAPLGNALRNNFPNPFNPKTTIRFDLASSLRVTLAVYDLSGGLVKTLVSGEHLAEGLHTVVWNGTSQDGRQVSAGVYFYRLEAGKFNETKRMVLLK